MPALSTIQKCSVCQRECGEKSRICSAGFCRAPRRERSIAWEVLIVAAVLALLFWLTKSG